MSRMLFLILILLFLDLIAYQILKQTSDERIPYPFSTDKHAFIYQKKDLILDEDEEFRFFEYFGILSAKEPDLHYRKENDTIVVIVNDRTICFPYTVKEKEVIEHETVIIKEIPVYLKQSEKETAQSPKEPVCVSNEPYLKLRQSKYSFPAETEISTIIEAVRNAVETNETVTVDYSQVNPNVKGEYPVYFLGEVHSCTLNVEIF